MELKAVLFDLDGTLLPMDQKEFTKAYFGGLAKKLAPLGYDSEELIRAIWAGSDAMVKNRGEKTNEEVFFDTFSAILGERVKADKPVLDDYYENEFEKVREVCGYDATAKCAVDEIRAMGLKTVLATNPLFPAIATKNRMHWAGFSEDDFEFYTAYENSSYTKPSLAYYESIIKKLGLCPEECLMVGNDVLEDMVAKELGLDVFLITRCLINRENTDISCFNQGDFNDLIAYIKSRGES